MTKSNNPKFRIFIFPLLLLIVVCFMFATPAHFLSPEKPITAIAAKDTVSHNGNTNAASRYNVLYDQMNLDSLGLSHEAFNYALQGYMDLVSTGALKNDHILSIVDFSLPSS